MIKVMFELWCSITKPNYEEHGPAELVANFIIIKHKTGLFWEHQADHMACRHPFCEGYILPFFGDVYHECGFVGEYTEESKKRSMLEIDISLSKLDVDIESEDFKSDKRSGLLKTHIQKARFDYDRKEEFVEAWIPVKVWFVDDDIPREGYLCLDNCD